MMLAKIQRIGKVKVGLERINNIEYARVRLPMKEWSGKQVFVYLADISGSKVILLSEHELEKTLDSSEHSFENKINKILKDVNTLLKRLDYMVSKLEGIQKSEELFDKNSESYKEAPEHPSSIFDKCTEQKSVPREFEEYVERIRLSLKYLEKATTNAKDKSEIYRQAVETVENVLREVKSKFSKDDYQRFVNFLKKELSFVRFVLDIGDPNL